LVLNFALQIKKNQDESESEVSSVDRGELWKLARLQADGSYINTKVKEVAERIVSYLSV
jgi:hypothetical protein